MKSGKSRVSPTMCPPIGRLKASRCPIRGDILTPPRRDTGFAQVNGARLYYEAAGAGHPLVLVHAGIADCRMWDEQVDAFAEHHRVIRYDLRGFGRSDMPPGPFAHHDDLRGLLRALG